MFLAREAHVTDGTLERLDVAVRHDVQLQLIEPMELSGTVHVLLERTLELLVGVVNQSVPLELVLPVKLFSALVAGEGQVTRVYKLVYLH